MSKVNTPKFRVAFPAVFRPKHNDLNGKDEYSLVALFPPLNEMDATQKTQWDKVVEAAQAALTKKFGTNKKKWPGDPAKYRSPFRDQGDREKTDKETGKKTLPQGYVKGATYLTLRSTQRPGVVDKQVQEIIDESEFYGGCWAIASINAYAYDQKGNRGVSFGLGNLQKVKDDDAFGNRTKPTDDFEAVADTSSGDQKQSANSLFT